MPGRQRQLSLWDSASQICLLSKYRSRRDTVSKNKAHGSRGTIPEVVPASIHTHMYPHICVHTQTHRYTHTGTCKHVHTYTHNVTHSSLVLDPSQSPQASCCFREAGLCPQPPGFTPPSSLLLLSQPVYQAISVIQLPLYAQIKEVSSCLKHPKSSSTRRHSLRGQLPSLR